MLIFQIWALLVLAMSIGGVGECNQTRICKDIILQTVKIIILLHLYLKIQTLQTIFL